MRRGLPVHPGSMLWIAELGQVRFLGLPGCGMFSMATAADLVLPRLLTGEQLDATSLAELAHGGVLNRDMRFRMPEVRPGHGDARSGHHPAVDRRAGRVTLFTSPRARSHLPAPRAETTP